MRARPPSLSPLGAAFSTSLPHTCAATPQDLRANDAVDLWDVGGDSEPSIVYWSCSRTRGALTVRRCLANMQQELRAASRCAQLSRQSISFLAAI